MRLSPCTAALTFLAYPSLVPFGSSPHLFAAAASASPLVQGNHEPSSQSHGDNGGLSLPSRGRNTGSVSLPFFASLERMARLVDIAYCVGTTGVSPPFSCASRCKEFPSLRLVRTWNTGVLATDSCGYIAIDDGSISNGGGGSAGGRGEDKKEIVVAFRGTYSIANTIIDLSTVPQEYVPYPGDGGDGDGDGDGRKGEKCDNCTVHMGFMSSWESAREVVIPVVKAAREGNPGYRVHLVGHSLGGAVAALAALEMKLSLGWDDVIVTTFGEPRVGNKGLARYLDKAFGLLDEEEGNNGEGRTYRRVTHVGDPVPLLPLSEWGFRSHAGEVFISRSELQPGPEDLRVCRGDNDQECMGGAESEDWLSRMLGWLAWGKKENMAVSSSEVADAGEQEILEARGFPTRLRLWQLFFAHRDYFWRLGLCVPGGDPADWGRGRLGVPLGGGDDL